MVFDSSFTHLTMPATTQIFHSAVFAIATNKPIVNFQFWEDLYQALSSKSSIPILENYVPKFNPPINLRLNRKTLFFGKVLVFGGHAQRNKFHPIIEACGGSTMVLNRDTNCNQAGLIFVKKDEETNAKSDGKSSAVSSETLEACRNDLNLVSSNQVRCSILFGKISNLIKNEKVETTKSKEEQSPETIFLSLEKKFLEFGVKFSTTNSIKLNLDAAIENIPVFLRQNKVSKNIIVGLLSDVEELLQYVDQFTFDGLVCKLSRSLLAAPIPVLAECSFYVLNGLLAKVEARSSTLFNTYHNSLLIAKKANILHRVFWGLDSINSVFEHQDIAMDDLKKLYKFAVRSLSETHFDHIAELLEKLLYWWEKE